MFTYYYLKFDKSSLAQCDGSQGIVTIGRCQRSALTYHLVPLVVASRARTADGNGVLFVS